MILTLFKTTFKIFKKIIRRIQFLLSINWVKTLGFNLKMLPFSQAKKLPVLFFGKVLFSGLSGEIKIDAPIKFGLVGFGQKYELIKTSKRNAQLTINGKFIVKGHIQFGPDYVIIINKGGVLEMGNFSSLGGSGKIICFKKIKFDDFARVGFESQVMDTNFHKMKDIETDMLLPSIKNVVLGKYNYIGNRVSIMPGTKTPDFCTVTSSSLCNKDYTSWGEKILIGGVPAKLIKNNISRAWEEEMNQLIAFLTIK